jgi:N-acetylmuramoyl-L-alanine amidase
MREIKYIIIHYSETPWHQDIGVEEIRQWHIERGWRNIGYHWVVRLDGFIEEGRKEEIQGAHAYGYNEYSIGICYVGGINQHNEKTDTRNPSQKKALLKLLKELKQRYPKAEIIGHNEVSGKECPGFDAKKEYENIINRPSENREVALNNITKLCENILEIVKELKNPYI